MAAPNRSFTGRMASLGSVTSAIESWDDGDFEDGDGFLLQHSTTHSLSSRLSVRSESNAGDDDWTVLLTPNDGVSTTNAINSAKKAGIPIPASVPSSALLGGSIKRLGSKKAARKVDVDDDWGNDLVLPSDASGGLKLKPPVPRTPAEEDHDDFDDWGEGSLGIRFAGTRRDVRGGRSSSVSAMSPSLGSCMTLESEDDDLQGLVLPNEPLDLISRLDRLKRSEAPTSDAAPPLASVPADDAPPSPTTTSAAAAPPLGIEPFTSPPLDNESFESFLSPPLETGPFSPPKPSPKPSPKSSSRLSIQNDDDDDFLNGLDFGQGEIFDSKKLTINRNVIVKKPAVRSMAPPAARPAATLTFTDKAPSRIPRPPPASTRTRLTPVYESGAPTQPASRPVPTTTSSQLLRAKRSAPILRSSNPPPIPRSHAPFLPAGSTTSQSHHIKGKDSQSHLRRDSDLRRPLSPSMRTFSRMSGSHPTETPNRAGVRQELAPSALARHPPPKKLTKPQRKRNYGDGHELDIFDDLPTSATKEKQFEKTPRNVASNKSLRQQPSNSRLPMPDRMVTPQPQTPRSPPKMDFTPRFARDTAASRNAREQRLAGTRSRGEGQIAQRPTSWQAQVAARSPHSSPNTHRRKGTGQKPQLIRQMTQPYSSNEKGMIYNPTLQRWEGNDDALAPFSQPNTSTTTLALATASTPTFAPPRSHFSRQHDRSHSMSHTALSTIYAAQKMMSLRAPKVAPPPPPAPAPAPVASPSPPRPALISQISVPRGVQYDGRMVFDPVKMTWLKAARATNDPRSPSTDVDDEEDPFAGLEDLKDNESVAGGNNTMGSGSASNIEDPTFVGEEFDVGPSFMRRQREEEAAWRRRVDGWMGGIRDNGEQRGGWRWAIREFAANASARAAAI